MRKRPLLELFAPRTRRRGSTSQTKCLCAEENKKERKVVSEEVCSRSVHSYVCIMFNVYMCLCVYTSAFFLYLVLCPASCMTRSSLSVPSSTGRLPNNGSHVCLA